MSNAKSLSALLQQTTLDDHEEVLKIANNVLKTSKTDITAQHIRLVALLKLDRYDDALRVLAEAGDGLKERATLEWAYALYRTGQLAEAEEALKGDSSGDRSNAILEAQTAYRLEDFARAAALYGQLARQEGADDSEESDLKINRSAVDAQLAWAGPAQLSHKKQPDREDLEQFDTTFNAACCYIARAEYKQAGFLLQRAKELCNAADELSESDRKVELLPIAVQQMYVLSRLGKLEEAGRIRSSLRLTDFPDLATRYIAQTNINSGEHNANPYLAQRMIQSTSQLPVQDTPFKFQKSLLARNALSLDLQANKFKAVIKAATSTSSNETSAADAAWSGVALAAAQARNQTGKAAIGLLLPLLEKRSNDIGLILTIVQLYVLTKNTQTATSLLETFLSRLEQSSSQVDLDLCYTPGLVVTLVSLYSQKNRITSARAELAKAARYWRRRAKGDGTAPPVSLLQAAAAALLESPTREEDIQLAHEIFASSTHNDASNPTLQAGALASSPSPSSPPTSAPNLPSIAKLTSSIDTSALESAGVAKPPSASTTPTQHSAHSNKRAAPAAASKPPKPKKIRASKMPKDFDPNRKPDPERWLPLRDRSNWRPKGRKKGKGQGQGGGMGTQGGIVVEEASAAPSSQTPSQQQKAGGPLKAKQKKKGKGK